MAVKELRDRLQGEESDRCSVVVVVVVVAEEKENCNKEGLQCTTGDGTF